MSTFAVEAPDGSVSLSDDATRPIKDSLRAAKEDRKRFEPTWQSNLAFAAGKFWLKWDRTQRKLVLPQDFTEKEWYSADVITEYRTTALGELGSDDDRPELLLRRDDQPSEDFQDQLNKAVSWGWDYEWMGDEVLEEMRRLVVDLGTAGVRCRFDPSVGPVMLDNVPYSNGQPVLDPMEAMSLFANGVNPNVRMGSVQRGRIKWEPLSPFNMLVPPGIPHERDFPWEAVVRPVPLISARAEYPGLADVREDNDIGSVLGLDTQVEAGDTTSAIGGGSGGKAGRVRGHIWLTTYYERPTPKFPDGRTITFATNQLKPVRIINRLPYKTPDGTPSSGIAYFHWWRVTGRFWSRSLVEAMKDPQRIINKRRTQENEIIDRGMPAIFVETKSKAKGRRGLPNELIDIGPQERQPTIFPGVGPGQWMNDNVEAMRADLEHATGIRGPRLGENPQNVTTYAQLALLNENDQTKRQQILREMQAGIARLVEFSVYDIRTYWGPNRQIQLAGDEDSIEAHVFNATKVPDFFIVKVAKGSAKPRSQAAELKKIEEIWNGALASGAVVQDPVGWVNWLKESFEQGQALELPDVGNTVHEENARLENHLLLNGQADQVHVQYYDPVDVHIPTHREAQVIASQNGDIPTWQAIEDHVQKHLLMHQTVQTGLAQMSNPNLPPGSPPGAPPGAGGGPQPGYIGLQGGTGQGGPGLAGQPYAPTT